MYVSHRPVPSQPDCYQRVLENKQETTHLILPSAMQHTVGTATNTHTQTLFHSPSLFHSFTFSLFRSLNLPLHLSIFLTLQLPYPTKSSFRLTSSSDWKPEDNRFAYQWYLNLKPQIETQSSHPNNNRTRVAKRSLSGLLGGPSTEFKPL